MSMIKKKQTREVSIEAGSMADITFLLLLFFLVTTTIDVDTGIYLTLPEYVPPEEQIQQEMSSEQLITVNINEEGLVLVSGERMEIPNIQAFLVPKITQRIENKNKLIVSIKTARGTNYNLYIEAMDAIKGAFFEVSEAYARRNFGKALYELNEAENDEIKEKIPKNISIAEPEQVQ